MEIKKELALSAAGFLALGVAAVYGQKLQSTADGGLSPGLLGELQKTLRFISLNEGLSDPFISGAVVCTTTTLSFKYVPGRFIENNPDKKPKKAIPATRETIYVANMIFMTLVKVIPLITNYFITHQIDFNLGVGKGLLYGVLCTGIGTILEHNPKSQSVRDGTITDPRYSWSEAMQVGMSSGLNLATYMALTFLVLKIHKSTREQFAYIIPLKLTLPPASIVVLMECLSLISSKELSEWNGWNEKKVQKVVFMALCGMSLAPYYASVLNHRISNLTKLQLSLGGGISGTALAYGREKIKDY